MNEERIQEIMKIEQQVQALQEDAQRKAADLPLQAEQEVKDLLERTQKEAEEEARQIASNLQAGEITDRIRKEADEAAIQLENKAQMNLDQAVQYVLDRVAGRA